MPSDEIIQRLAFVRYLYRFAAEQSRAPEPFNSVALLLFHDSIEMFLQLGLEHLNTTGKDPNFSQYIDLVGKAITPNVLTQREAMRRLNKARVNLKHYGTRPSQLDMEAFRAASASFFYDNTPLVFGIAFEDVSLSLLIADTASRTRFQKAEALHRESKMREAAQQLALAFALLLHAYRRDPHAHRRRPYLRQLDRDEYGNMSPEFRDLIESLKASVEGLQEELAELRLGLDPVRLSAFKRLVPGAMVVESGAHSTWTDPRTPELTEDEYHFCYTFVIESALNLQRLGTIPALRDLS
jgi:hypothetical protein